MSYIKRFIDIGMSDIALVGGKNASLGQMLRELRNMHIDIPDGFAVTSEAYRDYITHNKLKERILKLLSDITLDTDVKLLATLSHTIRTLIINGTFPLEIERAIVQAYRDLSKDHQERASSVAVRSSATAEDLPGASFAGQQETYLHVLGEKNVCNAVKRCMASLFTERAIIYRLQKNFAHDAVAISVGIQRMVRSDVGSSGVAFSLDTETGFKDVVVINASWGLGEAIVSGAVTPDEFIVHKPTLIKGFSSIIKKERGNKKIKVIYAKRELVKKVAVTKKDQKAWSLSDDDVIELSKKVVVIENYYSQLNNKWTPMDIEWAKDGIDHKLYIIQARPETIYSARADKKPVIVRYSFVEEPKNPPILSGQSIGQSMASGSIRIIKSVSEIARVQVGDIIVTRMTNPDWVPAMKKAAAIITQQGGRTCHAAIVSRELGVPALVGAQNALRILSQGQIVTLDCSRGATGYVYDGALVYEKHETALADIPKIATRIMINSANPDSAFASAALPVSGIGLARIEFIIANQIKIHPLALLHFDKVTEKKTRAYIQKQTEGYKNKADFFIETLARGIGMLAASQYPKPVTVRFSDFKTNEYRDLVGGNLFEPIEENPMLGLRGASRYYHASYQEAFELECAAIRMVRSQFGLDNIHIMVPFVRTIAEADAVKAILAKQQLIDQKNLDLIMMCEIPSNVLLLEEFAKRFDGFSIGSNDLTQLTLGVDRDSSVIASLFNEQDAAIVLFIQKAIRKAKSISKPIGICGQAPSDYQDFAQMLIDHGIDSISLNPDSVLPFLLAQSRHS